jgi:cytochrome c oxidase subunit 2
VGLILTAGFGLQLAGCGGGSPSTLDSQGPGASRVESLWWLMFWISVAVFVVVTALLLWAVARRRQADTRVLEGGDRLVVIGGVIVPTLVLTGVYLVGLRDLAALSAPPSEADVTVEVVGHDWWWEVRYPEYGFTTANEIHVPAGRPVRLRLSSADVVHSFWVPQLMPKTDLIPGQTNETWLVADRPGTYRGQCAEYCGLQHALMAILVVAEEPGAFDGWVALQRQPAAEPVGTMATRGRQVLESTSCAACHTVRGTSASGTAGPDLTHFASRRQLGAGAAPNTPGHLGGWIANSQTIKPGNLMPPQPLTPDQLQALIAYLDTLE